MIENLRLNARGRAVFAVLESVAEVAALALLIGAGWALASLLV